MYSNAFLFWKTVFQDGSCLISVVFNTLLIYLIATKSPKKMGNYKYLVAYFSLFAMFFSIIDQVSKPYILSYRHCFIALVDLNETGFSHNFGQLLMCTLCGCYGTTISFFAVHFVYRYYALERQGKLRYFKGKYIIIWMILPIFAGTCWGTLMHVYIGPSETTNEYVRENLMENLNISVENTTYIGALYFIPNKDNTGDSINYKHFQGMIILMTIVATSLSFVFFYGLKSYRVIKKLTQEEGESNYTKSLQRQLYKALVVQAILPIFTMYAPIEMYLLSPIFGLEVAGLCQFVTFIYALYPALDPLPLLFIIDNYRNGILNFLPQRSSRSINPEIEESRNTNSSKI